jgi:hypothetical protein
MLPPFSGLKLQGWVHVQSTEAGGSSDLLKRRGVIASSRSREMLNRELRKTAFYGAVKAPNISYIMFLSGHHPSAI